MSIAQKTKPRKAKSNKFETFLSQPSEFYCDDILDLNAKTNVECHYCTQKGGC